MSDSQPQPPAMKKQNSYTYWVDPNNKSRDLPAQHQPKKLDAPIQQTTSNAQGASAWNSLGTWEEKKIPLPEVQAQVAEAVKQFLNKPEYEGIEVGKVEIEGDAYKVYKKGKWHVMYDVHGSVQIKKQQNKAKLKISELHSLGDKEFETSGNQELRKVVDSNTNTFFKIIEDVFLKYNS